MTVSGIRFLNGKSVGVPETNDVDRHRGDRFINNSVVGPVAWSFIDTHGDDHLLAGNVCEATSSVVGTQGHCFYISYGNGVKLRYNVGSGAPGYGIHVFDQQRATVDFKRVISNVLTEGNLLKNSTERSGLILAMGDEGGLGNVIDGVQVWNVKIYNNSFVENGRQGLLVGSGALLVGIDIRNNLFAQSDNSVCTLFCSWYSAAHMQIDPAATGKVVIRNNGYFALPPTLIGISDPLLITGTITFKNPALFDFAVLPGGSSIDRGELLA